MIWVSLRDKNSQPGYGKLKNYLKCCFCLSKGKIGQLWLRKAEAQMGKVLSAFCIFLCCFQPTLKLRQTRCLKLNFLSRNFSFQ